jgi:hypothetical protein
LLVSIRPSTAKRHLADLRMRTGLSTEQLIYAGRARGWLIVSDTNIGRRPTFMSSVRPAGPRPGHCGWEDVLFLRMNVELGQPMGAAETTLEYVRDPLNRWAAEPTDHTDVMTLGTFKPSVTPPDGVAFSGYAYADGMELWRSDRATDALVFLHRGDIWEQWPRMKTLIGCM